MESNLSDKGWLGSHANMRSGEFDTGQFFSISPKAHGPSRVPSSDQAWLAGKWTIYVIYENLHSVRGFSVHLRDFGPSQFSQQEPYFPGHPAILGFSPHLCCLYTHDGWELSLVFPFLTLSTGLPVGHKQTSLIFCWNTLLVSCPQNIYDVVLFVPFYYCYPNLCC